MGDNSLASKGLNMLLLAQIISIVSVVLSIFVKPLAVAGPLAALLLTVVGLSTASATHPAYRGALRVALAGIVVSILMGIFSHGLINGILTAGNAVLAFLIVSNVCTATGTLLAARGDHVRAERSVLVGRLYLVCTAISVVCYVLSAVPFIGILAGIVHILVTIVQVAAYILYLLFLSGASNSLRG